MKKATPRPAASVRAKRYNTSSVFVKTIIRLVLVMIAATYTGGVFAHEGRPFEAHNAGVLSAYASKRSLFVRESKFETYSPFVSSLIVQIGFNPLNQPADFAAGVPNPSTQPLRIQTLNADGVGENVTGLGQTVFIAISTSSSTGRFDLSPSGAFSGSTLTLTVTSNRQNTQDFFYRDPTPGTVALTATVTVVANTGLTLGKTTTVTKSVLAVGENKLSFGTQPSNTNKGATIAPPVTVRVEDSSGNLITGSTRNVALAIGNNPAAGNLSGTTTVAAVGGIATFNNLHIDKAGNGYTFVASAALPAPALANATSLPFNINKLDQSIVFDELEDRTYGDDDFEVHAASSSGSAVTFSSLTTNICAVKGGEVSIVAAGICTIRASLPGDADHNPADDVDRSFNVNKADATVVVAPYDVAYDGESHIATLISITGVNGEADAEVGTVDLSGTVHTNAGSYSNDSWTFIGADNYNDTSGTVDNRISRASVTAHAGGGSSTYNGNPASPSLCSISGPGYLGDLTCSNDPVTVGPNAGSYSVIATVSGTGLSNFDISKVDGNYSIEKGPTITTISLEVGPSTYRGTMFTATARVTGPGGLDQAVSPLTYSGDCLNVTAANGCAASAVYAESANHSGSIGSASLTIVKRQLTVTASSHVIRLGDPVPAITPSFEGFIASEPASVIDVLPTCSTAYTAASPVGTYPTNCSGGADNNYSFAYTPGTVTVGTAGCNFRGFFWPIGGANAYPNMSGPGGSFDSPLRRFRPNSTIPFLFAANCNGSWLTTGTQTLRAQKYMNGAPAGAPITELEFRQLGGLWFYNFRTRDFGSSAQGTWLFEATLSDGSRYSVWLSIRN